MKILNAFVGKSEKPTQAELSSALGTSSKIWDQFVDWLAKEQGVAVQEWKSYSPKYGWSLRLKVHFLVPMPCLTAYRRRGEAHFFSTDDHY